MKKWIWIRVHKRKVVVSAFVTVLALSLTACTDHTKAFQDEGDAVTKVEESVDTSADDSNSDKEREESKTSDLSIRIQQEGELTAIVCEGELVEEFSKVSVGNDKSHFMLQFQDDIENGNPTKGFELSFDFEKGEEAFAFYKSYLSEERHTTSDGENKVIFSIEGTKATWFLTGIDIPLDGVEIVKVFAFPGNSRKALGYEKISIADIGRETGIEGAATQELSFSIEGVYESLNLYQEGNPSLFIDQVPGGYRISYGEFVSPTVKPEVNTSSGQEQAEIRFDFALDDSSNNENWHFDLRLRKDSSGKVNADLAMLGTKSGDRVDTLARSNIRTGMYSYWEENVLTDRLKVEYENHKFRFTVENEYVTDWIEPTTISQEEYSFENVFSANEAGEQNMVTIQLRSYPTYTYAYVFDEVTQTPYNNLVYSQLDEGTTMDYQGIYHSSEGTEQYTVVVEENKITINDRYVADFTIEDVIMQWRQVPMTDMQTGEVKLASFRIEGQGEGEMYLTLGVFFREQLNVYAYRE